MLWHRHHLLFYRWQKKDRIEILHDMKHEYSQLEAFKFTNKEAKEEWEPELERVKIQLQTMINQVERNTQNNVMNSLGPSKVQIAHDFYLDGEYKFDIFPPLVTVDLKCANTKDLVAFIAECRQQLISLATKDIKIEIEQNFDKDLIQENLDRTSQMIAYIIELMGRMCAPIRDSEMDRLKKITVVEDQIVGIANMLQQMNLDMIKCLLDRLKPVLSREIVLYERSAFIQLYGNRTIFPIVQAQFTNIIENFINILGLEPKGVSFLDQEFLLWDRKRIVNFQKEIDGICKEATANIKNKNGLSEKVEETDPVHNLIRNRVKKIIQMQLSTGLVCATSFHEKEGIIGIASERLEMLSRKILRWTKHHLNVFGPLYSTILLNRN